MERDFHRGVFLKTGTLRPDSSETKAQVA